MGVGDSVPELGALGCFQSCGGGDLTIETLTELIGQIFVEIGVEGHLLALLAEDITGKEDVQGVVDAAAEVLDALPVVLLLLALLLVSNLGHEGVLILGVFVTTIALSAIACVVHGSFQKGQLLGFTVSDEIRYLLVGGLALLEKHLEDLLRDGAEAAVCVEHILLVIIIVLTVRVVIHIVITLASEGLSEGSFLEDGGRPAHWFPDKRTDSWLPLFRSL